MSVLIELEPGPGLEPKRRLSESGRRFLRRHRRPILIALPALLAALTTLLAAVAARVTPSRDELIESYRKEAQARFEARDYAAALVCNERRAQLNPTSAEDSQGLVLTLEALGQVRRARAIAERLAPYGDRLGHLPAHLWLGRHLAGSAAHSLAATRDSEFHLKHYLKERPHSGEANALLGMLYTVTKQPGRAEPYLIEASTDRPEMFLILTQVYMTQGKQDLAESAARRAMKVFGKQATASAENIDARLNWATTAVFLEDFEAAGQILKGGLKTRDDPRYHQALAALFVSRADILARRGETDLGVRLDLLEQGLDHDPANFDLLTRLAVLIQAGGATAEHVRATFQALLADGKAVPSVHFFLGIDAWEQGRADAARLHWEEAIRRVPRFAAAANNLAWLLAFSDPPQLDRAYELTRLAIDRDPNQPRFHDTRGRILLKMRRWKDALADFEVALARDPAIPQLHESLAEAYDHLGEPALAAAHRARVPEPTR